MLVDRRDASPWGTFKLCFQSNKQKIAIFNAEMSIMWLMEHMQLSFFIALSDVTVHFTATVTP